MAITPRDFFEAMNHFIVTLDTNRLPALFTGNTEFSSQILQCGRRYSHQEIVDTLANYGRTAEKQTTVLRDAIVVDRRGMWTVTLSGYPSKTGMIFVEVGDNNVRRYYDALA